MWQLHVSVDVEPVVLACQDDGAVIHQGHVETLSVLHLALKGRQQLKNKDKNNDIQQGNLIQGKAKVALKNWKNLFGDQREDSLTSLEVFFFYVIDF